MIDKVPHVVFKTRVRDESVGGENPYRWEDKTTEDLFGGKKVVVFSLPGAFTPTCSARHLPGFLDHADAILANAVDTIAFTAVNDVHVMHAWGKITRFMCAGAIYTATKKTEISDMRGLGRLMR